jgi:hypothetical protein
VLTRDQAGTRFSEDDLHEILAIITRVFDEEEASIPAGVEDKDLPKIANKLLGASKKKRKVKRKVWDEDDGRCGSKDRQEWSRMRHLLVFIAGEKA